MSTHVKTCSDLPDLDELPLLLSIASVARLLTVHDRTVRRWIEQGRMNTHSAGGRVLIARSELKRFLGVAP